LTLEDLEKYETATPSFSNASWKDVAPKLSLEALRGFQPTFHFLTPSVASLPPSFHREVMKASAKWLDVYHVHNGEAARVRFMDAVLAFLVHS
jgi:hypothetical protein